MNVIETVLDVLFGTARERELEQRVADLTTERDALRRQLQNIRIAHEPLHMAIFPPRIERKP